MARHHRDASARRPRSFCVTTAMIHYAKAVAHAAAEMSRRRRKRLFRCGLAKVPPTRYLFNNTCLDILAIAARCAGRNRYRKGHFEAAFAHPAKSVELDDNLPYDEPWGVDAADTPRAGRAPAGTGPCREAEVVYRADLGLDDTLARPCQHPENVWSLHGLHECLTRLGRMRKPASSSSVSISWRHMLTYRSSLPASAGCGRQRKTCLEHN